MRSTFYSLCLATAAISEKRFGAIDTFDNPQAATQLGAGWTRVRFPWADMQPNDSGQWNTSFFTDGQLARELAAGREVVGLIVNTPPWALQDGSVPGVPNGLYLREDDPNNLWATFVRRIVSQYAGRINHWIIWNEPDIWEPSYPGRTWGGNEKDFLQLLRVAYNVAKQTNPNAIVHLSAFTYWWDVNYGRTPFFKRLLDEMQKDRSAAEHNYYFDVASANLYFSTDQIYDLIAWHHQQMLAHGFDKPIWLTETNAAPSTDPAWPVPGAKFTITLDEQAHFIIQSLAMALAGGANRVAIYKMADVPADRAANPEPFGLVREDGSRRPAFSAFQVGANYLSGFTEAALTTRNDLYTIVTVKRGEGGWTTAAWTRQPSPQKISVPAHAKQATLVDWNGRKQTITARDGQYEIEIAGATCTGGCIIGGAPRLIVEGSIGTAKIDAPSNPSANAVADDARCDITGWNRNRNQGGHHHRYAPANEDADAHHLGHHDCHGNTHGDGDLYRDTSAHTPNNGDGDGHCDDSAFADDSADSICHTARGSRRIKRHVSAVHHRRAGHRRDRHRVVRHSQNHQTLMKIRLFHVIPPGAPPLRGHGLSRVSRRETRSQDAFVPNISTPDSHPSTPLRSAQDSDT